MRSSPSFVGSCSRSAGSRSSSARSSSRTRSRSRSRSGRGSSRRCGRSARRNRQVLGSVIVEALVVGVLASIVGLFLGFLLAKGLFKLFDAVGFTLPNSGLVFEPRAAVIALAAGILVTLLASVYPGLRATTVPPIAAVREGAVLLDEPLDRIRGVVRAIATTAVGVVLTVVAITTTPGNTLVSVLLAALGLILTLFGCALFPSRLAGALASIALGFAALLYGLFVPGLGTTGVLLWMGVGVLLVFFGVARVSTRLIPRLAAIMSPIARWAVFLLCVLVWPFFTLPWWLIRYGAWGPGSVVKRVLAFVPVLLLGPVFLAIGIASSLPLLIGIGALYTAVLLIFGACGSARRPPVGSRSGRWSSRA